jgi:hypothetical protein
MGVLLLGAVAAFALLGGGGDDSNSNDDDDGDRGSNSGFLGSRETPDPTRTPRPTSTPPTTSLGSLAATHTPSPPTAVATSAPPTTAPTKPPPPPTNIPIPPTATPTTAPASPELVDYVLCHSSQFCPGGDEDLVAGYTIYVVFQLAPVTTAFVEMEVFFDGAFEYNSPFTASSTGLYYDAIPYAQRAGLLSMDIYADGEYIDSMYGDVN